MTITKRTIQKKVSIPQEGPVRFDNTTTAENRPPTKASSQPFNKSLFTFIFISLSLLLAAVSWYYAVKKTIGIKPEFPDTYALCSLDGEDIYTVDEANSKVQCIVIQRSRILSTGSLSEISERSNQGRSNLQDDVGSRSSAHLPIKFIPRSAIVVPGISDSHGHILEYGASRQLLLEDCESSPAVVQHVREYILSHPALLNDTTRYIEGWGWDHTIWPKEEFPNLLEFEDDLILRGRRIVLQSKDGHAQWVSEAVLKEMHPIPEQIDGGIIIRDGLGNPTGIFLDKAQDLVKKPPITDDDRVHRFTFAVNDALSKGLTTLHDAGFDPASLAFFEKQAKLGQLPIRIYGMTYFDENAEYWGDRRSKIIDNNRLTVRSVKIFADGALRSGGAALYEPYADNPHTRGFMRIDPDVLHQVVPKFLKDGWQVNIHAIGDRSNAIVLDAFESALSNTNITDARPRIEHAQIMQPEDMKRLGRLGVIASIQPTHAISDMWYAQDRLGPERVKNLYAFRSMIDSGARITLGSDFPVEDMNPLAGFYAAITRVSPDGRSPHGPGGWFPDQRLTRIEALRGMTIEPAFASFSEADFGSLVPGKIADYVVLSQDIMTIPEDKILDTRVLATVLDGRPSYGEI